MATSKFTPDADAIISEIQIAAPPERVFQALVDPRQVVQWWGQIGVFRCTGFQCDLRVGGKWRTVGLDGQGHNFEIFGEYLAVDPPRLLVQSWTATWTGSARTTVRWELEATGQGTLVRITHSGFAAHPELAQSYRGWPRLLSWLQALIERGENVDDRKPVSAG